IGSKSTDTRCNGKIATSDPTNIFVHFVFVGVARPRVVDQNNRPRFIQESNRRVDGTQNRRLPYLHLLEGPLRTGPTNGALYGLGQTLNEVTTLDNIARRPATD